MEFNCIGGYPFHSRFFGVVVRSLGYRGIRESVAGGHAEVLCPMLRGERFILD